MTSINTLLFRSALKGSAWRVSAGALLTSLLLCSQPAFAEEEARAADVAAARELAIDGLKLADAGQCAQAIDKLSRAEKLHHAPIVLGRLGECQIAEGKVVDGTEALRRLLREPLPKDPPAQLLKARERAQTALDGAKPKIAYVTITVREPTENVTVTVDGQAVPSALFERSRPTDPGDHVIEATAPGYLNWSKQFSLSAGEKQELSVKLAVDPAAAAAAKANPPQEMTSTSSEPKVARSARPTQPLHTTPTNPEPAESPSYAPSYILWSVGAGAAAVGGVFGYLALKDKRDLSSQCANNVCDASLQGELDGAKHEALASTILLASGGGLIAIGTAIYLLTGPSQEKLPTETTATLRPTLGLGQVGLRGVF
jgi:hypothetical protein